LAWAARLVDDGVDAHSGNDVRRELQLSQQGLLARFLAGPPSWTRMATMGPGDFVRDDIVG
jgi:hypothetical protein